MITTSSSIVALLLALQAQPRPAPPPSPSPPYPMPPRALSLRCEPPLPPLPGRHPPGAAPARVRAQTGGPLERYFCWDDYPPAVRAQAIGRRVGLRLAIGPEGRVRDCAVTASSGLPELDRATCRILADRARLMPAIDARGQPTWDSMDQAIIWPRPVPAFLPAPPPPPVAAGPPAVGARARTNISSYFSTDDYPAAARRAEEQGTTAYGLVIGPDGRVQNCVVTGSSGSSALDAATCRIIRSRARYTPARDAAGLPTSDFDSGRIHWRLPRDQFWPPPEIALSYPRLPRRAQPPSALAPLGLLFQPSDFPEEVDALQTPPPPTMVSLLVGVDGRASDCRVTRSSGYARLDETACRILVARAGFAPARDRRGRAVAARAQLRLAWAAPQ